MGDSPSEIREEIAVTRERLAETAGAVAYKADVPSRVKDSIGGATRGVKDRLTGAASGTASGVSSAGGSIGRGVSGLGHGVTTSVRRTGEMTRSNPVAGFAGGVAIGMLLGMVIPKTRIERERLSEPAQQMKDKAMQAVSDAGQQALDKGKQMAEQVGDRATQAVESGQSQGGSSNEGEPTEGGSPWAMPEERTTPLPPPATPI